MPSVVELYGNGKKSVAFMKRFYFYQILNNKKA